jgi:hypothetical protein
MCTKGGEGGIYIFLNLCSHHVLNVFPKGVPIAPLFYPNYQLFYPIILNLLLISSTSNGTTKTFSCVVINVQIYC